VISEKPALTEVKEPFLAIEVLKHPSKNPIRESTVLLSFPREETDRLRRGVDINRIDPIVIVLRCTISQKEPFRIVPYALGICSSVFWRETRIENITNRLKIEARVEGIDPPLQTGIGVIP
jgi:hypothetical protein